jgi:hypothetical protein
MMKESVVLQAGHRAVFQTGSYATGGGSSGAPRDPHKPSSDDIGKIDEIYNKMISNRVVPNLSETSSTAQKQEFKIFMNEMLDHATDRVIRDGIKSGQFEPVFSHVMKERFISKDDLDAYLRKVDFTKFGDPDLYFSEVVSEAYEKAAKSAAFEKNPELKKNVGGSVSRILEEAKVRAQTKPEIAAKISELQSKLSIGLDGNCVAGVLNSLVD